MHGIFFDWGSATLSKYGVPKNAKVTKKCLIDKVRSYVDGLIKLIIQ